MTFLFGDYYCCRNVTDADLISYGASAFWRKGRGFCGRGGCETCSQEQDCIYFGGEDVFCCPQGYQTDEELLSTANNPGSRDHDHDHDDHHHHHKEDSTENHSNEEDTTHIKDEEDSSPEHNEDTEFREVIRPETHPSGIDSEDDKKKVDRLPPVIPPSPATSLRSKNASLITRMKTTTTTSTTTRKPDDNSENAFIESRVKDEKDRDEELEEILEHDHHMHDH